MAIYRKKPVVIEAWQWYGRTLADARKFSEVTGLPPFGVGSIKGESGLVVPTPVGDMIARKGDYIIRGIGRTYYPCPPEVFLASYDIIPDEEREACFGRVGSDDGYSHLCNSCPKELWDECHKAVLRNLVEEKSPAEDNLPKTSPTGDI